MKKILALIGASLGVLLLINGVAALFFTNINFGNFACIFVGLVFVAVTIYEEKLDSFCRNRLLKVLRNLAVIGCVVAVAFTFFLDIYGKSDNTDYKEDVLIVLGAGVRGEVVTRPLAFRLNVAADYLEKNPDAYVIVSGGQGNGEDISEAEAMFRYLSNKGVKAERIIKEDKSTSTYENFKFSKAIADKMFEPGYKAVFITNDFHVFRAERIGADAGFSLNHAGAPLDWYVFWPCTLREVMAVVKYFIFGY